MSTGGHAASTPSPLGTPAPKAGACPSCGAALDSEGRFCPECGKMI
ncbi:MAG: zinc ribbon domain-containing protein [Peptococcaceae bacterium]|nr:zinc ribbon domain-containing protein [Peptococcaceae bacterium]